MEKIDTAKFEVVFTADDSWWQVRQDDFEIDELANFEQEVVDWYTETHDAGFLGDCAECFACKIDSVDPDHTAIKAGDFVISEGAGSDKIFIRRR